MNLSEALDAALPEIPKSRLSRTRPPRLDPDLVVVEDLLDGEPFFGILQRGKGNFFRFQPVQWQLAQYFDGVRSYEEIATLFAEETGAAISPKDVEDFAVGLDEAEFWYKTAQEKNIAYSARLKAQRGRRANRKSKINLAHISFSAWDPDGYLTWLDQAFGRYIYSPWSVLAVIVLFCFEATVFVAKWKVLGPDIPLFFNFTHKGFVDFAEFWLLLFGLGFIHETAHGLTCKHYGGEVHSMGLMFLYLTPAFFVDVTESWVSATKIQRLATIIAGIWIEMTICGFAMIIWTNTQAGNFLHDFTYKIILITGLAVVVMNLNPLLKLDGYYFLAEVISIPDLKERSTAFVAAWFQSFVLRLPVEVPTIPKRRAPLFILYALISGAYSYLLLFAVIRFSYNLTSKLFAEFALIPAAALAFVMFRARLKSLRGVLRNFWNQHLGSNLRLRPLTVLAGLALIVVIFVPILRVRENAYFLVEAPSPTTLHASINGTVEAVYVREGQQVQAGQPLLRLSSSDATSLQSAAEVSSKSARYSAFEAQLEGHSIGRSAADQESASHSTALAAEAFSSLWVKAPEGGTILTEDPSALVNQRVAYGEALLTLAGIHQDSGRRAIRLFVPTGALKRVEPGDEVALSPPGEFSILRMKLPLLDGEAMTLPVGLVPHQDYKGIELPTFYSARLPNLGSDTDMALGTAGQAKIFGARRSLFSLALDEVVNLVQAHVW
jgi:putative peptide zinc metalloprotease protein